MGLFDSSQSKSSQTNQQLGQQAGGAATGITGRNNMLATAGGLVINPTGAKNIKVTGAAKHSVAPGSPAVTSGRGGSNNTSVDASVNTTINYTNSDLDAIHAVNDVAHDALVANSVVSLDALHALQHVAGDAIAGAQSNERDLVHGVLDVLSEQATHNAQIGSEAIQLGSNFGALSDPYSPVAQEIAHTTVGQGVPGTSAKTILLWVVIGGLAIYAFHRL